MIISTDKETYLPQLYLLSFRKYLQEASEHPISPMGEASFAELFTRESEKLDAVIALNDSGRCVGFLFYEVNLTDNGIVCDIPCWGCCFDDEKTLSRLFQSLAESLAEDGIILFRVHIYANDIVAHREFSFLQFYMVSEKCLRLSGEEIPQGGYLVKELSKPELANVWAEVYSLIQKLIDHLAGSPIYYVSDELTQANYHEFLFREATRVFAAYDDDRIIGIIETNDEEPVFPFAKTEAVNIGDVFVEQSYRGKGVAQSLLSFAEQQSGSSYVWVDHGTANPNSRGFWDKYFGAYEYLMLRYIEK